MISMKHSHSFAKGFLFLFTILSIACTEIQNVDESALEGLPHFEYSGYTYYVHSNLGVFPYGDYDGKTESFPAPSYKEIKNAVKDLDSYGVTNWFIPSTSELLEAVKTIELSKDYAYCSSTIHDNGNFDVVFYRNDCWNNTDIPSQVSVWWKIPAITVVPMVKYRIQQ